jgi:IclR family acetate operon transcriptional repressor
VEESPEGAKPATTLQTVERALTFLEVVADSPRPLRPKDVAEHLGVPLPTSYHLLNTLLHRGYITKEADGTLSIGSRVALLHHGLLRRFAVGSASRKVVDELSISTGETSYLTGYSDEGVVIQAVREGTQAVAVTGLRIGFSGSEHVRASAKAVLAFLPKDEWTALVKRAMGRVSKAEYARVVSQLEREFVQIRRRGWAIDDEGYQDGVCCVGAPYFGADGTVLGSMALSAPIARFKLTKDTLTTAVLEASDEISELLGLRARREA